MTALKLLWLLLLHCLFSCQPISDVSYSKKQQEWLQEVKSSLKKDLRGTCDWTFSTKKEKRESLDNRKSSSNSFIKVALYYPTKNEVTEYKSKSLSINKGNSKLVQITQAPNLVEWVNDKEVRWQVPTDHPGQDRHMCINTTRTLGLGHAANYFYNRYNDADGTPGIERISFLMRSRNAIIYPSGAVMMACGEFQGAEACETRWDHSLNPMRVCRKYLKKNNIAWDSFIQKITVQPSTPVVATTAAGGSNTPAEVMSQLLKLCAHNNTLIRRYKKVLTISAAMDFNFHHVIADSLSRLARYTSLLRKHKDIMVHIYDFQTKYKRQDFEVIGSLRSREMLLRLLGIDRQRVISGMVYADKLLLPRMMSCSDSLRNPMEVRLLALQLVKQAKVEVMSTSKSSQYSSRITTTSDVSSSSSSAIVSKTAAAGDMAQQLHNTGTGNYINTRKNIVILVRKNPGWGHRDWDESQSASVERAFRQRFPQHNIVTHSSLAVTQSDFCLACEIMDMAQADIIVGIHGAGLTKLMFMPASGLVVELTGLLNDVQMPVCGYYGNWAQMFGHHHYLYGYDRDNGNKVSELMDPEDVAEEVLKYYTFIHSEKSKHLRQPVLALK